MKIITKIREMQDISISHRSEGKKIAVVPTMGYFHDGHASLMKRAKELADIVIVTLFVNPTQFAPNEDFSRYPRNFDRDNKIAEESGVDYIFYPSVSDMYPSDYSTMLIMSGVTQKFEGAFRPDHFKGVATIVAKLFNITLPHIAVFGQKDYQQTLVVRQFTRDLNFPVSILVAPTHREADGLAMSSRNIYLSPEEREQATIIDKSLEVAIDAVEGGERRRKIINAIMHNSLRSNPGIRIDYASSALADNLDEPEEFKPGESIVLLIAVYQGKTRLIDNALVTLPK
jgi:pantoate--beta-alanine ligase